ncbi:MAG: hypothetical protein ABSH49_10670 [Bryobacteraceae bacterium]|jgi:hypothetical protein
MGDHFIGRIEWTVKRTLFGIIELFVDNAPLRWRVLVVGPQKLGQDVITAASLTAYEGHSL